jgi:hypothetical protein
MNVISPGSPVIHARRVAVQYWISSPGYIGAPVRASLPLYLAFIVLIVIHHPIGHDFGKVCAGHVAHV